MPRVFTRSPSVPVWADEIFTETLLDLRNLGRRGPVYKPVPCPWGWCSNDVDPTTGKIVGGFGPVMCPCDHLPGWNAKHPQGMGKPPVPVKARGRHGSRAQRSRRRHRLPDYRSIGEWLPARGVNE